MRQTEASPARESVRPRRFTLADGLLIVAALAAGFAMVRQWTTPRWCADGPFFNFPANASVARQAHYFLALAVSWSIPFAIAIMPALLAARFRSGWRPIERIAQQPGTVACAAALICIVLRPVQDAFYFIFDSLTHSNSRMQLPSPPFVRLFGSSRYSPAQVMHELVLEMFPRATAPAVGIAVLIAWLVLLAINRFRPERDWVDRTGRALGLYWMVLPVLISTMTALRSLLL